MREREREKDQNDGGKVVLQKNLPLLVHRPVSVSTVVALRLLLVTARKVCALPLMLSLKRITITISAGEAAAAGISFHLPGQVAVKA